MAMGSFLKLVLLANLLISGDRVEAFSLEVRETPPLPFQKSNINVNANVLRPVQNGVRNRNSRMVLHQSRQEESVSTSTEHENGSTFTKSLHFNMINLLQKEEDPEVDAKKRKKLLMLVKACAGVHANQSKDSAGGNENDGTGTSAGTSQSSTTTVEVPDHLASMKLFLRNSSNLQDHRGCFRIFGKNKHENHSNCNSDSDLNSNLDLDSSSIPPTSTSNISLPSNVLFSMDQPLSFIRQSLSYQSDATLAKKGGMMCDNLEAVVWSVSEEQDLEYASRVLDDMPFAQLHVGVGNGNGGQNGDCDCTYRVELDVETIQTLESLGVLYEFGKEEDNKKSNNCENSNEESKATSARSILCEVNQQDLDAIRTFLSCNINADANDNHEINKFLQACESPVQQTLIKLIDAAVESVRKDPLGQSNEPHLVLMAHSISSTEVAAALSTWKKQKLMTASKNRVEDLMHQAITVVTFGNICQSFCDGPAYMHISMWDDPLCRSLGRTRQNSQGGGRDAVYFHAWSPYADEENVSGGDGTSGADAEIVPMSSLKGHNAHNLNACLIQFLCLIMRINGIQSFRALYDAARYVDPRSILDINPKHFAVDYSKQGDLVLPPRIDDELLPAMIRATGGDQWMWTNHDHGNERNGCESGSDALLPDEIEATAHLEESFGYSAYEEIYEICCKR